MKEQIMQKIQKLHKGCLIVACIHWLVTFFTDHLIFDYVMWDMSNTTQMIKTAMTYGAKAVFLLVLIGIYQGGYFLFTKADKRFVRYTLIYFCINIILLLLTWPGIWRMDEFGILNSAVLLLPVFWQNYLTSLFYVFALMLIPIPSGVIIIQCVINSLVVGYLLKLLTDKWGKWGLLAFVPFLLLPVLDSNLYPMRMSVYAFLELLLLILLYQKWEMRQKEASKKWLFICALAAVVTVWRTEAIYYMVLFPVLLAILFVKFMDKKQLVKVICAYLIISLCLFIPQSLGDKLTSGNQYDLTSVVLPLVPLVEEAYESGECQEQLSAIDQVINVEVTVKGAKEGRSGINLFWGEPDFQRTYTDADYRAFKSAYYELILQFPMTFLEERFTCFVESTDLLENTTELFTKEGVVNYDIFKNYPLTKPFSDDVRSTVVKGLEWREAENYTVEKDGYGLIYSHLLPIGMLCLGWLVCLLKRKWHLFFLISLPLIKVPLIFLTAPSRLFMYYYSLYLIGYFVLFAVMAAVCAKLWSKVGGPIQKTINYAKRNGIKAAFYAAMERVDRKHIDDMTRKALAYTGCKEWSYALSEEELVKEKEKQKKCKFSYAPLISIVVPTYETDATFLQELLVSVREQTYANWELVLADASQSSKVKDVLDKGWLSDASVGKKIRYIRLLENKGISDNTNEAIDKASGDYIALLDHDDVLTQDALYSMVEKLNESMNVPVLAVYSDEDKCDGTMEQFYEPHFKPDFNLDLLLSNNYICHFLMVEASAMKELKLRKEYDGAQDYDLILRLAKKSMQEQKAFLHVDKVLYHWRCHQGSTAGNTESKRYAYDAGRRALETYFAGGVNVTDSVHLGFYKVKYEPDIFAMREDVAAVCGRVINNGIVVGGMFTGLRATSSGYMHRASLYMDCEITDVDKRALRLRPDLTNELEDALKKGMKLVYDPEFVVEV
ncbi:MAG: glycosyltransferase [Lachnospiraceae bacterium]|nr:glycosyltransferase [Lachnospiraceae bacterium]